jgi:serine/threonine-protein kinase
MSESRETPLPARLSKALGDHYTIEGEVGRGGMGVVYRARDERLQRRVAIKVLPPELAFQKDIRQRFTREAQTAARLSHPHIVPIHTVGEGEGLVFFIMGYVDGESLNQRLKRRGPLQAEEARRIIKETADALSAAHAVSIIHRDIKPDNILLEGTRGRVMVTDFGIAKALSSSSGATLTGAGVAIGTPSYMSPEQAAGESEIDGRSDLYSLGIVSYQILTGDLPFTAPTVAGILMKQITEPAPLLTDSRPDLPEDLSLAVSRCLEKDPENRWPSADSLRRALESRTVSGYRPTGLGWRAQRGTSRPLTGARPQRSARQVPARRPSRDLARRPGSDLRRGAGIGGARLDHARYGRDRPGRVRQSSEDQLPTRDTGEPKIVQRVRREFARWASVSGGLFLLDVVTSGFPDWSLVVAGIWAGFGLVPRYARLWQAGYSWRDVLSRPPAPDSIERTLKKKGGKLPRQLPAPSVREYGAYVDRIEHMQRDRAAILKQWQSLPATEREMLPEIVETVDRLFERGQKLGRVLRDMDIAEVSAAEAEDIERRLDEARRGPEDDERRRHIQLLERQQKNIQSLQGQRREALRNLESCYLAMQNLRFDLLRLKSSSINEVLGELTQVTQQARALSRDVDHAISAVDEIRDVVK